MTVTSLSLICESWSSYDLGLSEVVFIREKSGCSYCYMGRSLVEDISSFLSIYRRKSMLRQPNAR